MMLGRVAIRHEFLEFGQERIEVNQATSLREFNLRAHLTALGFAAASYAVFACIGVFLDGGNVAHGMALLTAFATHGVVINTFQAAELKRIYTIKESRKLVSILGVDEPGYAGRCCFETSRGRIQAPAGAYELWLATGRPDQATHIVEVEVREGGK